MDNKLLYAEKIPEINSDSGALKVKAKAVISRYEYLMNSVDGDTVRFKIIEGYNAGKIITVRFIGINAPEVQHYKLTKDISKIKNEEDLIKNMIEVYKDSKGNYVEISKLDEKDKARYEADKEMFKNGIKAKDYLLDKLGILGYARGKRTFTKNDLMQDYESPITVTLLLDEQNLSIKDQYTYTVGLDVYGRHLGEVYINIDGVDINLNKTMLLQGFGVVPYTNIFNAGATTISKVFKMQDYIKIYSEINKAIGASQDEIYSDPPIDDRSEKFSKIYYKIKPALSYDDLFIIGDSVFIIPPTSIKVGNYTSSVKVATLRTSGSNTTNPTHNEAFISVEMYFSGNNINGYKINDKLPNGEEITYYMNGLLSLIAQFKKCPLLPITNSYINLSHNIDFVALEQINISTVEGMPNVLKAEIIMSAVESLAYINDIEADKKISDYYNWPLYRYYYQKSILDKNSNTYIKPLEEQNGNVVMTGDIEFSLATQESLEEYKNLYLRYQDYIKKTYSTFSNNSDIENIKPKDFVTLLQIKHKIYNDIKYNIDKLVALVYRNFDGSYTNLQKAIKNYITNGNETKSNVRTRKDIDKSITGYYMYTNGVNEKSITKSINMKNAWYIAVPINNYPIAILEYGKHYVFGPDKDKSSNYSNYLEGIGKGFNDVYFNKDIKIIDLLELETSSDSWLLSFIEFLDSIKSSIVNYFIGEENKEKYKNVRIPKTGIFLIDPTQVDLTYFGYSKDEAKKIKEMLINVGLFNNTAIKTDNNATINEIIKSLKDAHDLFEKIGDILMTDDEIKIGGGNEKFILTPLQNELEDFESFIKRKAVDTSGMYVEHINVGMANYFAKAHLLNLNDNVVQYLGCSDSEVIITGKIVGIENVRRIKHMYDESLRRAREYKDFIKTSILEVKNEIINMCGIKQVLFKSVEISTIEGIPEVFNFSIVLSSFDKTSRNRQELEKIYSDYSRKLNDTTSISQGYTELIERLTQIEVYPDLELPTNDEIRSKGFIIKDNGGLFVDPDFYISYSSIKTFESVLSDAISTTVDSNYSLYDVNLSLSLDYELKNIESLTPDNIKDTKNKEYVKSVLESYSINIEEINKTVMYRNQANYDAMNYRPSQEKGAGLGAEISTGHNNLDYVVTTSAEYKALESIGISPVFVKRNGINCQKAKEKIMSRIYAAMGANGLTNSKYAKEVLATGKKSVKGAISGKTYDLSSHYYADWAMPTPEEIHKYIDILIDVYGITNDQVIRNLIHSTTIIESTDRHFVPLKNKPIFNSPGKYPANNKYNYMQYTEINGKYYVVTTPETEIAFFKGSQSQKFNTYDMLAVGLGQIYLPTSVSDENKYINSTAINEVTNKIVYNPYVNLEFMIKTLISKYETHLVNKNIEDGYIVAGESELNGNGIIASIDRARWLGACVDYFGHKKKMDMFKKASQDIASKSFKTRAGKYIKNFTQVSKYTNAISIKNGVPEAETIASFASASSQTSGNSFEVVPTVGGNFTFILDLEQIHKDMFFDAQKYDKKGRLLRAFPTFLVILIDEGKKIFNWKFHDNFYGYNAIQEINIARSRKSVASTCTITMANTFNSHWRWNFDSLKDRETTLADAVESFFNTGEYIAENEKYRETAVRLSMVSPGNRIHVRIGYGANAADLPVKFNGTITEFQNGDIATIVAMSDGIELMNRLPVGYKETVGQTSIEEDNPLKAIWDWFMNASGEPREFILKMFTTKGGWFKKKINTSSDNRFFNDNALGIVHFGDENFKDIFYGAGEIEQNIFAATDSDFVQFSVGNGKTISSHIAAFDNDDPMYDVSNKSFSMLLYGKTPWDVISTCTLLCKDYVASVEPFEFRSTLFFGKPYYPMAYGYDYSNFRRSINENIIINNEENSSISQEETHSDGEYNKNRVEYTGTGKTGIKEKRKVFKQAHVFTSYTDIIRNNIKATENGVYTCAIGTYVNSGALNMKSNAQTHAVFADTDIYPEKQKTVIVDTNFYSKGTAIIGLLPFVNKIKNNLSTINDVLQITRASLAEYLRDMYSGELVVLGYPAIKPRDYIYIFDDYNKMSGLAEVKQVFDVMSIETGYITTIVPDACVCQHDRVIKTTWASVGTIATLATSQIAGRIITTITGRKLLPFARFLLGSYGIITKTVGNVGKYTSILVKDVVGNSIKNVDEVKDAIKASAKTVAANADDMIKNTSKIKTSLTKIFSKLKDVDYVKYADEIIKYGDDMVDAAKATLTVASAFNPVALLLVLLEIGAEYVIERTVVQYVKNYLIDRQAVSMTTLKQYGYEFSAGINGHSGLVIGDSLSAKDKFIKKLFSTDIIKILWPDIAETAEYTYTNVENKKTPISALFNSYHSKFINNKKDNEIELYRSNYLEEIKTGSTEYLKTISEELGISVDESAINAAIEKGSNSQGFNIGEYTDVGNAICTIAKNYIGCAYAWGAHGQQAQQYVNDNGVIKAGGKAKWQNETQEYLNKNPQYKDQPAFDCSGLVWYIIAKLTKQDVNKIRSNARKVYYDAKASKNNLTMHDITNIKIGDFVFYSNEYKPDNTNIPIYARRSSRDPEKITHIAIYCGNGQIIEAPSSGKGVRISSLHKSDSYLYYNVARLTI